MKSLTVKCGVICWFAVLISCSSGPAAPEKGTPAFYWQAAKETFAAGDNMKTLEHLDKIMADDNEYAAKALPWSLVLSSGMATGYAELADHYEIGARVNKSDPSAFRRPMGEYRGYANRLALQFADKLTKFGQLKGDTVAMAFGLPKGSAGPAPQLVKVTNGIALAPAEAEAAAKHTLERDVLLAACRAAGAPDDAAKGEAILKDPEAKVARATFAMSMAQSLYDFSQLYGPRKLDDPEKMRILCERSQELLKSVPESKDTRALDGKIQAAIKKK